MEVSALSSRGSCQKSSREQQKRRAEPWDVSISRSIVWDVKVSRHSMERCSDTHGDPVFAGRKERRRSCCTVISYQRDASVRAKTALFI